MPTATDARFYLRWRIAKGHPMERGRFPEGWDALLDELVSEGLASEGAGGVLTPRPNSEARKYVDTAADATAAGMRLILTTLEEEGEVDARTWRRRAMASGISADHIDLARQWLRRSGMTVTEEGRTRPMQPLWWVKPTPKPEPTPTPQQQPNTAPAQHRDPVHAPAPVASAASAPKPAPAPKPARPNVKLPAKPTPPAPDPDDEKTLLRRLVHAAEVSAGLVAAPTRVRTPLGASPLLDTQLRLCVVLAAAGRPLLSSEITRGHLTSGQKEWAAAALADGVRRGGFTATDGRGARGARYSLSDPTVFDATWESVNAAVAAQRQARERRRVGSAS